MKAMDIAFVDAASNLEAEESDRRNQDLQNPASHDCTKSPALEQGTAPRAKKPLQPEQVWAIRARLELATKLRNLTLFNHAINSKPRGCDLVRLHVEYLIICNSVRVRASATRRQTARPVQFEASENAREVILRWITTLGPGFITRMWRSPRERLLMERPLSIGRNVWPNAAIP